MVGFWSNLQSTGVLFEELIITQLSNFRNFSWLNIELFYGTIVWAPLTLSCQLLVRKLQ